MRRMHKLSLVLVVSLAALSTGCRKRVVVLYPSSSVAFASTGAGACVERLLAKSRFTGYIEQTVDKDMGFFRVETREKRPFIVDGRKVFLVEGSGKKEQRKLFAKMPEGYGFAVVRFYNVQCTGPDSAIVVPMNDRGPLEPTDLMDAAQRVELERYASAIGGTPVLPAAPFGGE